MDIPLNITSKRVIQFYQNNPQYDVNKMNEIFVEFLTTMQMVGVVNAKNDVNFFSTCLKNIDNKLDEIRDKDHSLEEKINQCIQMCFQASKSIYMDKIDAALKDKANSIETNYGEIVTLIRETNSNFIERVHLQLQTMMPEQSKALSDNLKSIMESNLNSELKPLLSDKSNSASTICSAIESKLPVICSQFVSQAMDSKLHNLQLTQSNVNQSVQDIYKQLQGILDIRKNSTLKGKESEEKLEAILVENYPSARIRNCSGESKTCDFVIERQSQRKILIENKDYKTNVPNEEIKKFIRDVEHQSCHAILLSQNTGVQNKENYQIDVHMGNILVYVHHVKYDISKIRIAINMIDHLSHHLDKIPSNHQAFLTLDQLTQINKEYIDFIQQKNVLIENLKKFYRDHMKQIESFEMNNLTTILNKTFSNVDQLTYTCNICKKFIAKSKRALTTHQNSCRKKLEETKAENSNIIDYSTQESQLQQKITKHTKNEIKKKKPQVLHTNQGLMFKSK